MVTCWRVLAFTIHSYIVSASYIGGGQNRVTLDDHRLQQSKLSGSQPTRGKAASGFDPLPSHGPSKLRKPCGTCSLAPPRETQVWVGWRPSSRLERSEPFANEQSVHLRVHCVHCDTEATCGIPAVFSLLSEAHC